MGTEPREEGSGWEKTRRDMYTNKEEEEEEEEIPARHSVGKVAYGRSSLVHQHKHGRGRRMNVVSGVAS